MVVNPRVAFPQGHKYIFWDLCRVVARGRGGVLGTDAEGQAMVQIRALPVEGPRAAPQWSYRQFPKLGFGIVWSFISISFFSFSLFLFILSEFNFFPN